MSKELSRRDFLKAATMLGASFAMPRKEGESPELPLDVFPERTATYSLPPFGNDLEAIMGDGVFPGLGYRHLQETVNVDYSLDGGHHIGVDFNCGDFDEDLGTPLRLIMNGVCVFVGDGDYRDLGKIAMFCHRLPDGTLIYTRYCHLDSWDAEVGTNYRAGEIIGTMGKSGWPNGFSPLHFDAGNRELFERHWQEDPWWYPNRAPVSYINRFFVDPAELIQRYLRRLKNSPHIPEE